MLKRAFGLAAIALCALNGQDALVTTAQYGNYRTNANLNEKLLNIWDVNPYTFGKLGSYRVDGAVFAQPLYVPQLHVSGSRTLNVLLLATMHNTVFAFDADQPGSAPLWQQTLAPPVPTNYAGTCPSGNYTGQLGILSTPVIDVGTGTIYLVYATPSGSDTYAHYVAALDIVTGVHKFGSPNLIQASVSGNGYDSKGGTVSLNQITYLQRAALTLVNGNVYAGFASCGPDPDPYHGWMIGYKATNVKSQSSVYNSTPNGSRGGIWQSGRGLVADDSGALYALTGNGTNSGTDHSDSVVKVSASGALLDWFTPGNFQDLNTYDLDLSSGGPLYTGSTHLLLGGGKQGLLYVLNPLSLGRAGSPLQTLQATANCGTLQFDGCHQIHSLAYWDSEWNSLLYVWGAYDNLRSYRLSNGQFDPVPNSQSSLMAGSTGGILALSAYGDWPITAVLWALTSDGVLHAFQATDVSHELYNSSQNYSRDGLGTPVKFAEPTVANGKVYVATADGQVKVYGLLFSH